MSPFHDLGQHCGGSLPVESSRGLRSSGLTLAAGGNRGANTELQAISSRFVRLLSLGVVGLAGLHSRGVGGVVLVQGSAFRVSKVESRDLTGASRHEEASYSRALYVPPNHRDGVVRPTRADEETDDE
jgi:hypothetical protein